MDPPDMNGMTIHSASLCTKDVWSLRTLGWFARLMACVSLKISSRSRFIFSSSTVFSATTSPSGLHSARHTRLDAPTPASACFS